MLEAVRFFIDPRLGRGTVLLGASLVLLGFLAQFVSTTGEQASKIVASALEVAIDGAANIWLTPGAAVAVLWILWRRRSRISMRAARAAVFGLAAGGALPLIYTTRRIGVVADAYTADVQWSWGLWLMVAGLLLAALGGWARQLGCARKRGEEYVPLLLNHTDAIRPGYTRAGHCDARCVQQLAVRANAATRIKPNPN